MMKTTLAALIVTLFVCIANARADDDVESLRASYQAVRTALLNQGYFDPSRIAEVIAPRFIQYSDWTPKKSDSRVNYDPWLVYCPAPTTWQSWEKGNTLVSRVANWDAVHGYASPLTVEWIKAVWESAMSGLQSPGFRKHEAAGPQWTRSWALSKKQIESIEGFEHDGLLKWTGIKCFEDLDSDVREKFGNQPFNPELNLSYFPETKKFFKDDSGVKRQCGYIQYGPASRIESELQAMAQEWVKWTGLMRSQPFLAASYFQRWLVAVHPYRNGNGRLSRFLMDRIIISAGLPAPLLSDMNQDLFMSTEEWAAEIRRGVVRAITEMKRCAVTPTALGCQEVRKTQPTIIPEGVCKVEF